MIHWLLEQLEHNPGVVFSEHRLRSRFGDAADRGIADGLLRRLPLPGDGESYVAPDGTRYSLTADGTGWKGLAVERGDIDVITVGVRDVLRCEVDVLAVASRLRDVNGLGGPEVVTLGRRAVLLGEAKNEAARTAYILGLLSNAEDARTLLPAVPARLPETVERIVVACATFVPDAVLERHLDSLSIEPARIEPASLRIRRRQAPPRRDETFRHSEDFRTVNYHGVEYPLTGRQAQAIELLYRASQRGTSSLGQDYIMEEIGSPGSRLRDLFRDSPLWGSLIVPGEAKGTFRLNI